MLPQSYHLLWESQPSLASTVHGPGRVSLAPKTEETGLE